MERSEEKLQTDELNRVLIELVRCGLNGEVPSEEKLAQVDGQKLFERAQRQTLVSLCCMVLEKTRVFGTWDAKLVKKWTDARLKAIRKNMLMDAEREKLCDYMEEQGIWYLPLKGSVLKDLYPEYGMRQMADNDILFDAKYRAEVKKYMESQGYLVERYRKSNHDVYMKEPVYNFEMHVSLFQAHRDDKRSRYYEDITKRTKKILGKHYGLQFTDEEFYLYLILHMCKHAESHGTGLRSLSDVYVYLQKKGSTLDWAYIEKQTENLQVKEFEESVRGLAKKVFSPEAGMLTSEDWRDLEEFLVGTYGSRNLYIERLLRKNDKNHKITRTDRIRYCLRRLFPDMEFYRNGIPFLYRHKYLIPFFVVYRMFRAVFVSGKRIFGEVSIVKKVGKEE